MSKAPTKKYGLQWHIKADRAVSVGASHGGPSHSGGEDVTYTDMLLRLSPNGPYSMVAVPEPVEGLDGTLCLLYKRQQDQFNKISFRKVEAGLYQLHEDSVTGDAR